MTKLTQILIALFTFLIVFNCKSQNLITNDSFESYTNPLNCYGGFDNYNASPVYHVLDNWYTLNSSDYFNGTCANSTFFSTQQNLFGSQNAKDGIAYPGFILYGISYETKEYIYQQLSAPLQAGKMYCLSFYISRADRITHAIHSIGAYFSNNVQSTTTLGYINAIPQVINQTGFITDTLNWVEIQGCFTAIGGEQYITIGNFNSNANTDTLYVGTNNQLPNANKYAYYYIDKITLIDQSTVGIKSLSNNNAFAIFPNPTTGLLNFSDERYSNGECNFQVLDIFGKEIINGTLNKEIDISSFDRGVYTLLLYKNKQLVVTKKVMKD